MERFAFLIHPISVRRDVARKYGIARYLPEPWVEQLLTLIPPKTVSHITGVRSRTGSEAEGWFVGCPLTPRQFLSLDERFVIDKIARAARVAAREGAKIVGLGAVYLYRRRRRHQRGAPGGYRRDHRQQLHLLHRD